MKIQGLNGIPKYFLGMILRRFVILHVGATSIINLLYILYSLKDSCWDIKFCLRGKSLFGYKKDEGTFNSIAVQ